MSALVEAFFEKKNIILELNMLAIENDEREKLLKITDELAELRFLNVILGKLEEKDKELFLEQVHNGQPEILAEFLREKLGDVEELIKEHAVDLEQEVVNDIRSLRGQQ